MSETEAVKALTNCKTIYQRLTTTHNYYLNEEDLGCLKKLVQVYDCGLFDEEAVLKAAGLTINDAATLVGIMVTKELIK